MGLTEEERERPEGLVARGNAPARQPTHARILLEADEGASPDAPGEARPDTTRIADAPERSAARRSVGCAGGSWRRAWRRRWSIAGP